MRKVEYETLNIPTRFQNKIRKDLEYLGTYNDIAIEQIILFGSAAREACKVTSDIDLLIITKEPVERYVRGDISSYLEEEIEQVKTDVVFYQREIFENATSLFATQVRKDGIIIYERSQQNES